MLHDKYVKHPFKKRFWILNLESHSCLARALIPGYNILPAPKHASLCVPLMFSVSFSPIKKKKQNPATLDFLSVQ